MHHRKLDRWLQPGGHGARGERDASVVALREAREETGIEVLRLHNEAPRPVDVDVHEIPAREGEPAHQHLDLRYLAIAPEGAKLVRSETEAIELRWFRWDQLAELGLDSGLQRGLDKARFWTAP